MNVKIWNAPALGAFTASLESGLRAVGADCGGAQTVDFGIAQIHGAPHSAFADQLILEKCRNSEFPIVCLIHRPDEALDNRDLMSAVAAFEPLRFVFLGDLVLRSPFWRERSARCTVIPHPFTDLSMPSENGPWIVGSFTSWGEMRKIEHALKLFEELRASRLFSFRVGGPGFSGAILPRDVAVAQKFFVPHFNVQLYHLRGRKRIGESSGSLHRGVTIPVIFEANGAERLEGLRAIKVDADDALARADFAGAARAIEALARDGLPQALRANHKQALLNSPAAFARALLKALEA